MAAVFCKTEGSLVKTRWHVVLFWPLVGWLCVMKFLIGMLNGGSVYETASSIGPCESLLNFTWWKRIWKNINIKAVWKKGSKIVTQSLYIVFNVLQMSVLALTVSFIFYIYSQQQIKLTQKSACTPTSLPSPCLIRPTMPQSMILP